MIRTEESNPFKITTPEDLTAEETVSLFVDVFSDFSQIIDPGHVILKGPRGVGKSMMFRYLQPDCQCLKTKKSISELPFIAIYIPLKNTNFTLTELRRFENKHANAILNEHLMVTHCIIRVLDNLISSGEFSNNYRYKEIKNFYDNSFIDLLNLPKKRLANKQTIEILKCMLRQIKDVYNTTIDYVKKCSFTNIISPYTGNLYDYINYFVPLLKALSSSISDCNSTFYLLLDDAHFLSDTQTRILNTWVATRTSRKVSLKISTQYNYKTYYTVNGATIDTPHDYIEMDIATVYTQSQKNPKATYFRRISDIVEKRMKLYDIPVSIDKFFPPDIEQEKKIKAIEKKYIKQFDEDKGRGNKRTDDARRYARPDFIKSLSGTSKSGHTYSYAGFEQLVNISSGVVRYFLQQAHTMYAKAQAISSSEKILYIKPSIQNDVVRDIANKFLFNELETFEQEGHEDAYPKEDIQKLSNLIQGLGGLFRKVLLSERSERRVFSVAINDKPDEDVLKIFNIGIQLGYFHRSTIGRKDSGSIGRTRLYVLNRRLAPIWNLDPNGFAGYLFVRNQVLKDMILNPIKAIRTTQVDNNDDNIQLSLFEMTPTIAIEGADDNE